MNDETERLEVAKRIGWCFDDSHMCDPLGCDECVKQAKEAAAILSRRDSLMKKRGAVEELKRMDEKSKKIDEKTGKTIMWGMHSHYEDILPRIKKLEREIKAMEEGKE